MSRRYRRRGREDRKYVRQAKHWVRSVTEFDGIAIPKASGAIQGFSQAAGAIVTILGPASRLGTLLRTRGEVVLSAATAIPAGQQIAGAAILATFAEGLIGTGAAFQIPSRPGNIATAVWQELGDALGYPTRDVLAGRTHDGTRVLWESPWCLTAPVAASGVNPTEGLVQRLHVDSKAMAQVDTGDVLALLVVGTNSGNATMNVDAICGLSILLGEPQR